MKSGELQSRVLEELLGASGGERGEGTWGSKRETFDKRSLK